MVYLIHPEWPPAGTTTTGTSNHLPILTCSLSPHTGQVSGRPMHAVGTQGPCVSVRCVFKSPLSPKTQRESGPAVSKLSLLFRPKWIVEWLTIPRTLSDAR